MRKVKVPLSDTFDYGYTFYIRGEKIVFTSKRAYTEHLNLLNKKFTDYANILNIAYTELYVKYREEYFILNTSELSYLKNRFSSLETYIENLVKRTVSVNGLYFAINFIDHSIEELNEIVKVFEANAKKRSDTSFVYWLKSKKEFVSFLGIQAAEMRIKKLDKTQLTNQLKNHG